MRECWRVSATACFFIFFGVGGIILGYILFPGLKLFYRDKQTLQNKAQYAIYLLFGFMVAMLKNLGLIKFSFHGFEKLSQDSGCLILANHPSLLDYVIIVSKLPRCDNIVKQELWQNTFIRNVISTAGYIPNLQANETFEAISKALKSGNNLLMFPEGTRTIPQQPIQLKRGAAQLAIRLEAPIRLIHITCMPVLLTKQEKWYKLPKTQPHFTLTVGERIEPSRYFAETPLPSVAARQLTRYLQEKLDTGA
jgi:1-acyl-sn-glycerol-3-phosphate acyltransferase